jgi:hypothetical protein
MINVEGQLTYYNPRADRSYTMKFVTAKEVTIAEATAIHDCYQVNGRLVFATNKDAALEAANEPPPAPKPEDGKKSKSQILRNCLFKEWEQAQNNFLSSESYYELRMNQIINEVKNGFEPPLPEER